MPDIYSQVREWIGDMAAPASRKLPEIIAGLLLLILVMVILSLFIFPPVSPLPHITPDPSLLRSPPANGTHTFPYENTTITITVPVNVSVSAGAAKVERRAVNLHNATGIEGEMYVAMIDDPAQEPLFEDLLSRFRTIRAERNLSDDEYLELLMGYVQSFDYTVSDEPARYPVETVLDGGGDCDDKSLLLAGLLAREGYPVALFLFRPEQHMAVGVGSDGPLYRSTGYAYIEATEFAFAGIPPTTLRGNITLASDPVVIPISTGTKRYHAGNETRSIDTRTEYLGGKIASLSRDLRAMPGSTAENRSAYAALTREIDGYAVVYTYVLTHKFDRPGVYAYLEREMPGGSG